jgi:predicted Zn finger-like uncharacterized protein
VQAQCPECTTRFQLDDSKVPDHAFKVRCPRCQHVVVLPGRQDAATPGPAEDPAPAAPQSPPRPPRPPRREHTGSDKARDALIAIPDADLAKAFTETLARLDYNVDVAEDVEEGARLLEQGAYAVAVAAGGADGAQEDGLARRIMRLTPDMRRQVFVILAGDQFKTADGTQAWSAMVDLVVKSSEVTTCEGFIRSTMSERRRLYQTFLDAQRRLEED